MSEESFLAVLGVACAAFCVWLGVRVVNRRERWPKRLAIGLFVVLVIFGPYVTAYTNMVKPRLPDKWSNIDGRDLARIAGPGKIELIPDYDPFDPVTRSYAGRDQAFWENVFEPVHWLDRRVRLDRWVIRIPRRPALDK